ncbi:nucleoporin Ndc1 [Wyeomyia smithii]|uniref:nucleoporin Ndc1 n=1 Tax=Wyeomyia smithii TaxID=174621 RepID=UPI0024681801|nr:nucleoporin Ndc1 [Wyeomyia smithii]
MSVFESDTTTVSYREKECRTICGERFVYAIAYSIGAQYVLLVVFLLLVNLSLLHPVGWLWGSFQLFCSITTWLYTMPLISAIIIYGIILAKSFFTGGECPRTRFQQLIRSMNQKCALLLVNCAIGFLTAWLYTRFVREDYNVLFLPNKNGTYVLNEKYLFLLLGGMVAGVYYFVKNKFDKSTVYFPVIQQARFLQIRAQLYSILYRSLFKSFVPTMIYVSFFYIFGSAYLRYKLADFFHGVTLAEESLLGSFCSIVFDVRIILYCWILFSHILSNMKLMQMMIFMFLTEYKEFPLERAAEVSLVEALACKQFPIIQQLAALNLFSIAEDCDPRRRAQLYALSIPGGHPYNWNSVSNECIRLIREFSVELHKSIQNVTLKPSPKVAKLRPTASMDAEKLIAKQYNESFGIRSLSSAVSGSVPEVPKTQNGDAGQILDRKFDLLRSLIHSIPAYRFFFVKTKPQACYLESNQCQQIVWISQALASLAAQSIVEDKFGVVQKSLPTILKTLLQLKETVDRISTIQLDVKRIDRNYLALKAATKRSLYRITHAFADYLADLRLEPHDLEVLQGFVHYREV